MKPSDYHGIALWDKQLNRTPGYTHKEQAYAARTNAPADAIYSDGAHGWVCVSDLAPNHTFRVDYAVYLRRKDVLPFHYIRRLHELYPNEYPEPTFDLVIIDRAQRHRVSPNTWDRAKDAEDEFIQEGRAGFADIYDWGETSWIPRPTSKRPDPVPVSKLSTLRMAAGNERLYSRVILNNSVRFWVGIGWVNEGPAQEKDFEVYPVVID